MGWEIKSLGRGQKSKPCLPHYIYYFIILLFYPNFLLLIILPLRPYLYLGKRQGRVGLGWVTH